VVLVPGFSCSWDKPFVRRVARWLTPYAGVVVLDLRGQGQSGGLSTLGNLEALDVDAAVAQARALGYARVVTVGFSMGGAAVLRQAGLHGELTAERVDAVVSISAASRWWRLETRRMRNLARLTTTRPGRGVARALMRTRIDPRARYGVAAAPVDVHVRRLRAKLGPEHEQLIGTVRHVGYKFVTPPITALADDGRHRTVRLPEAVTY
jgi:pimeloyl-ACP methyl ester carboxylesterase